MALTSGQCDDGVAGAPMGLHIVPHPGGIGRFAVHPVQVQRILTRQIQIRRIGKMTRDPRDLGLGECQRTIPQRRPGGLDAAAEFVETEFADQEFEA
jgi:hypothetical protein